MRGTWIIGLAGALLAAAAPTVATAAEAPRRPLIVAHRGGALLMPENSFPAFDHAMRLGVDLLEFDVQMTQDDQLVITHDGTVNATFCTPDPGSGVTAGPVRALTLAQLEKFDCGSKHRAIYAGQKAVPGTRMPTLDALLARYKDAPVEFYGETKMPDAANEGTVDPVQFARLMDAAVRRHGLEDRFILQSRDWRTIAAMHEINPRIRTCLYGFQNNKIDLLELARQYHAGCLLLRAQDADAAKVKALRAAGIIVYSEVVDDEAGWRRYFERGDDALVTNDPAGAIAFLDRHTPAKTPRRRTR